MNPSDWSLSRVAMAAILPLCLCVSASAADPPRLPEEAILNRVHAFTGLDTMFEVDSIENVPASTANVPFLAKALVGKTAIKVTFKRGKLKLKSVPAGFRDKYDDRQFVILLDADAKNLLSVTSTISKKDPDIHPESLDKVEARLRNTGESYESLPTSDPKVTFLDALEIIQKDGVGQPFLFREIEGIYVMHSGFDSKLNRQTSAKWIISLRGGPPLPMMPESMPIWQRNHTRESVDATSGEWLGADSVP